MLAAIVLLGVAAVWLLWDNRRLDVTAYEVPVSDLPEAVDGLRIAQVSDLHAADFGTFPERVVEAVDEAQPDLVALTGDLIDIGTTDLTGALGVAEQLQQIAPTYFVLGNHEADSALQEELLEGLRDRGIVVLRDEAVTLEHEGTPIALVGVDDPRAAQAESAGTETSGVGPAGTDPQEVLARSGIDPSRTPTILLAHRPELFAQHAGGGIDLVLSGHAHGGQIRLPGVGGLYAPHQGWLPELSEGMHTRDGTTMVVSRGLGNSIIAVRVNDPRELVLVELRTA